MRYKYLISLTALAALVAAFVVTSATQRRAGTVPPRQTFDRSAEGWIAFGTGATVRVTNQRENVKEGAGALELEYTASKDRVGSAVLPVTDLARMQSLRFWIKTDVDTAIGAVITEKPGGGIYTAWFWSPKNQWQHLELAPADFALNESPTDPKDGNGRLDLDALQGLGIVDLGQFFGQVGQDPKYPVVVTPVTGVHRLQVDEFQISPDRPTQPPAPARIGDPARGFISWITLGGVSLTLSARDNPLSTAAFRADYEQTADKYIVLAHGLSNLTLGHLQMLQFDIASARPASLAVFLEERNPRAEFGSRYGTVMEVPGGSTPSRQNLSLSDFAFDDNSPADSDGRPTPGQLRSITFTDITGMTLKSPERNTLWISAIETAAR